MIQPICGLLGYNGCHHEWYEGSNPKAALFSLANQRRDVMMTRFLDAWDLTDTVISVEVWGPKSQVWLYKMGTPNPPRSFFGRMFFNDHDVVKMIQIHGELSRRWLWWCERLPPKITYWTCCARYIQAVGVKTDTISLSAPNFHQALYTLYISMQMGICTQVNWHRCWGHESGC